MFIYQKGGGGSFPVFNWRIIIDFFYVAAVHTYKAFYWVQRLNKVQMSSIFFFLKPLNVGYFMDVLASSYIVDDMAY